MGADRMLATDCDCYCMASPVNVMYSTVQRRSLFLYVNLLSESFLISFISSLQTIKKFICSTYLTPSIHPWFAQQLACSVMC